jgi:hypothetical protein
MVCEVASARFALSRPDPADPEITVEVALIRDWRKLLPVEESDETTDDHNWLADLDTEQTHFWEEGWQALPAPAAQTNLPSSVKYASRRCNWHHSQKEGGYPFVSGLKRADSDTTSTHLHSEEIGPTKTASPNANWYQTTRHSHPGDYDGARHGSDGASSNLL